VLALVHAALEEDGARNDVTTLALVPESQQGRAVLIAKGSGVACGLPVAEVTFTALDERVRFEAVACDGAAVSDGEVLATVAGPLAPILSAERVALNFVQRLSGIATATQALVDAVAGLPVSILDTRKTTPGMRAIERYAVRWGGGRNHRFNLSDAVLIKDNHLAVARARGLTIAAVLEEARRSAPDGMKTEIEVTTVDEAREALDAGVTFLLLDNMSLEEMRAIVALAGGRATLEASGNVTLENVRAIAQTGVDCISVGWITHSVPALDVSLEVEGGVTQR
jgi:nicotinate-nucleotide pyrophosphorylase (carboxylating)